MTCDLVMLRDCGSKDGIFKGIVMFEAINMNQDDVNIVDIRCDNI